MRLTKLLAAFALASAPIALVAAPGCGSSPSDTLCAKACACEHCNQFTKSKTCDEYSYAKKVTHDYGCDDAFTAYVQCQLDKGVCDDLHATFQTKKPGSCSALMNTALPCMTTAADCKLAPGSECTNGTCQYKVCADGSNTMCKIDDDCPASEDFCKDQLKAVAACVTKASKDPTLIEFLGGGQTTGGSSGGGGAKP